MSASDETLASIADEVFDAMGAPREVLPYTSRFPGYDLGDAYRVVEDLRRRKEARGERVVGRKIGFTNSAAWAGYGISGPIWNYLYDTTTLDLASTSAYPLRGWPNVRMEAEIAFGLCAAPHLEMDAHEPLGCIDWVALDFEICTSATTGVHVALLLGQRRSIGPDRERWAEGLRSFSATLFEVGGAMRRVGARRFWAARSRRSTISCGNWREPKAGPCKPATS